jgi:hypothetical protein
LAVRSGGVCEVALAEGCAGAARDVHHRVRRGVGGRRGAARLVSDRLSNLLHVCRPCHTWVHEHPAAAREVGWLLCGRDVPSGVAVSYRGAPCVLADDGRVEPGAGSGGAVAQS